MLSMADGSLLSGERDSKSKARRLLPLLFEALFFHSVYQRESCPALVLARERAAVAHLTAAALASLWLDQSFLYVLLPLLVILNAPLRLFASYVHRPRDMGYAFSAIFLLIVGVANRTLEKRVGPLPLRFDFFCCLYAPQLWHLIRSSFIYGLLLFIT
jgi:hypothetical protein